MKKREIDMSEGKMFSKIMLFTIPVILSGILQLLYNAADIIVVGQFAENGKECLAAVGATGSLNNLFVNLFLGLSIGSSVVASRYFGAKDRDGFSRILHTSILVSIICGIGLAIIITFFINPLLEIMGTPKDVIHLSAKYLRIIFMGLPGMLVYNYGAAILRAIGDTRRPLYILTFSGLINVALNVMFVIFFNMDVDGVALATIISQYISAILILLCLRRLKAMPRFSFRKLKVHKSELLSMLKIGIPSGINSSIFSLSNVIIQSAVNSYGSVIMAANSVASSLEGFVYAAMNSFHQAAITFVGQNVGAGKPHRLKRGIITCVASVVIVGFVMGNLMYIFGRQLSSIYTSDPEVINYAMLRMSVIICLYFICGVMDTLTGALRGLGHSVRPMLISIVAVCGFRMIFVLYGFPIIKRANELYGLYSLYFSWPISWIISIIFQVVLIVYFLKKININRQNN